MVIGPVPPDTICVWYSAGSPGRRAKVLSTRAPCTFMAKRALLSTIFLAALALPGTAGHSEERELTPVTDTQFQASPPDPYDPYS